MDESPEPTVVLRTLKEFNQFISSGSKSRQSGIPGNSRLRLNFSAASSDCSSILEESLDAPNVSKRKRPLPVDELTGLDVSKRFREKETELVDAKSTVTILEGRLQNVETSYKKARLETERELEDLKRKQLRDKELIDDLHHKIKVLQSQQKEAQDETHKVKLHCNNSTYEAESKAINMQREYIEQINILREEAAFLQQRVVDLETEVEEKTAEVGTTQCHAEELMEELSAAQCKLRESTSNQLQIETLELQLEQAKGKIRDLELERDELVDAGKKKQVFESAVTQMRILEKENAKLKQENKFFKDTAVNKKLLEEELVNAKQQLMLLKSRCDEMAQFEAKADLYKNNLKQFEAAIMDELNLRQKPTVEEFKLLISKLKNEDRQLTTGIEQLRASQKSIEGKQQHGEAEIQNMRMKLEKQLTVALQNAQIIKRLQRKILLLTQERDSLKRVLTTYEAELTINYSVVSQERIDKMESQLESYRDELKLMEEELEDSYKSAVEGTSTPKKRDRNERVLGMEKQLTELGDEVKKLNEANAALTQANEVLEGRIENLTQKGDFDPTTTKVLHFKNNPLSEAIENRESQLETLEKQNEALRERVRLLEEGEHDITQKVGMKVASEGHSSKDVLSLQEQITSIETRNKRLMELFKKKSLELREAICLLTGFRVDSTGDNRYKLTNMYAESSDDFFMFEVSADGEVQLLNTDFSETLDDFIETYLHRKNSYPAFLAAVTLDLFRRQTLTSPLSGVEEEMDDDEMDDDDDDRDRRSPIAIQMAMIQSEDGLHDAPDEEEEEEDEVEEEEEEEMEEEEEEEHEEGEDGDEDDLICLD